MEKNKIISDIRVFKSVIDNIDGNSMPSSLGCKEQNIVVRRIVMKLRENGFSLGDFDHLYVNMTTCLEAGEIVPAKRSIDRYHPWYRFYDVGIPQGEYDLLEKETCIPAVVECLKQVLMKYFASNEALEMMIGESIKEAVEQGENMLMRFKEKKAAKCSAILFLRLLDNGLYKPLLCVRDIDGRELLREDLAETSDLSSLGELQLSSKKVTVKPRKNAFTKDREPITFELE